MNDRKIKVVMCLPERKAFTTEISTSLESLQASVGGLIEFYYLDDGIMICCNDEGKINGMKLNRAIKDEAGNIIEVIAGPFFICKEDEESEDGFGDMSDAELQKAMSEFLYPDDIFMVGKDVIAIPYYEAS